MKLLSTLSLVSGLALFVLQLSLINAQVGSVSDLATSLGSIYQIAIDSTTIYTTDRFGQAIHSYTIAGGAVTTVVNSGLGQPVGQSEISGTMHHIMMACDTVWHFVPLRLAVSTI